MSGKKTTRTGLYFSLVLVALIWGGSFVAAKFLVSELSPLSAGTARFLLSSFFLVPLLWWQEKGKVLPRWQDLPLLFFLGLTGIFLYNLSFFYGLKYNPAGESAIIIASNPILITIFSAVLLQEAVSFRQVLGVLLAFFGVVVISAGGVPSRLWSTGFSPNHLILFGAPFSWAAFSLAGKVAMSRYSPLATTTYACLSGTVLLGGFLLWRGEGLPLTVLDASGWLALIFLAVFVTVLAFYLWYRGIDRLGASTAAIFVNLVPVSAMLFSALLFREPVHFYHLAGLFLVLSGVYLGTRLSPGNGASKPVAAKGIVTESSGHWRQDPARGGSFPVARPGLENPADRN